jgi:hypothetical protein
MVLSTVAACRVKKHDRLLAFAGVLVEDLGPTPHWGFQEHVFASQMVLFLFWLRILLDWSALRVVRELENAAPDMRPVREMGLVALYLDAFLLDVHAEHAPVALVRRDWDILEELLPLIWESGEREEGILRRAGLRLRRAVADFDEDRVVRAAGFDSEGCRLVNCIGSCERFQLAIGPEKLGEFVEASLESFGEIVPIAHGSVVLANCGGQVRSQASVVGIGDEEGSHNGLMFYSYTWSSVSPEL